MTIWGKESKSIPEISKLQQHNKLLECEAKWQGFKFTQIALSTLLSKNYVQNVPNNSKKYSFPLRLFFILIIPLFTSQASQGQLVISVSFPNVKRTLPPAVTTTFVNADAYSCFLEKEGLTWNPPRYKQQSKIPFIPSEAELNKLIRASSRTERNRSRPRRVSSYNK